MAINKKDEFFHAVESLKKYRRADLIDEKGKNILEDLYTDLLPNDHILKNCLKDNTTFLIGRKGTGKSTIFLRIEQELRKKENYLPCYLDVKTIYESAEAQFQYLEYLKDYIPQEILSKYLIERNFIQNVLKQIRDEIDKNFNSFLYKIKKVLGDNKIDLVKQNLQTLKQRIEDNELLREVEIPTLKKVTLNTQDKSGQSFESTTGLKAGVSASASKDPALTLNTEANYTDKNTLNSETQLQESFSQIFIQVFQITDIILEIKEILKALKIKNIVILLDDFSEISDDAIKTFVNVILAPLNNWSEEFIKFKIAAYPNRIFYGKIDPGKVDTVNLDFYNLYSEFERDRMEEGAVDFTRRLVNKRIQYFTGLSPEEYFDTTRTPVNDYYDLLFKASMNVPRIMGYILSFCFESRTIYDKLITKSDIDAASQRYYEEKIEPFFYKTTYSLQSLDEKIGTLQLKGLLEKIITRQSETKRRISAGDLKGEAYNISTPYSSHFYFDIGLEKYLKTLELNYFLSKYTEMTDKDGRLASIFCINYGFAQKHNIAWGKTSHRKYFIERPFNFNQLIRDFLNTTKNIRCTNSKCGQKFTQDQIPMLEFANFKCNRCGSQVIVENIADSIYDEILAIPQEKLLPKQELEIVHELSKNEESLFAREIAEELDISSYSVASKARILDEKKGLVKREKDKSGLLRYKLTEKGNDEYNF